LFEPTGLRLVLQYSNTPSQKQKIKVGCQQIRSIILATQEAEIRRMEIQSQLRANGSQDTIFLKKPITKKG
jgi:hypothetical protein